MQSLSDLLVFCLRHLFLPQRMLQFLVWLLRRQVLYLTLQGLNLSLGPFPDRSLSISIIRAFSLVFLLVDKLLDPISSHRRSFIYVVTATHLELLWGEICYPS
jgi:hypothetical protein